MLQSLTGSQSAAQAFMGKHKKTADLDEKQVTHETQPLLDVTVSEPPIQSDFFAPEIGSIDRQKRFVVIGDAGTGTKDQYAVARQMQDLYDQRPYGTVLALGDNAYKHGLPEDFRTKIAEPYRALFDKKVKFRPILGNHDVKYGHWQEQLKYWGNVPQYYTFTLGPKGSEVQFWALDTTILTPGKNGCYKSMDKKPIAQRQALQELAWLRKSLAESKAPMKVVYGHYPMYSEGPKATNPFGELIDEDRLAGQQELTNILAPILRENKVDLYLAGHEHHYERPKKVDGVHYMVSGAAGGLEKEDKAPKETRDLIRKCHFVSFDITPEGLNYQTISDKGEVIDEGLIAKQPQVERAPARRRLSCGNPCGAVTRTLVACCQGLGSLVGRIYASLRRAPQPKEEAYIV